MITRTKTTDTTTPERTEVPDGVHTARILEAQPSLTMSGIPYIDLKLEVAGYENAKRIYTKIWLSDGNSDRNYDALLSCGHQPDANDALPDPSAEMFENRTCKVRIGTNKRGYRDVTYWIAVATDQAYPARKGSSTLSTSGKPTAPAQKAGSSTLSTPLSGRSVNITHETLAGAPARPNFTRPTRATPALFTDDDGDQIPF
ncbi:MAG: hypothetical protein WCL08_10025 [Verrucomicrobiota bacterium]